MESKSIVVTKLIESCLDCIEKVNLYPKRSKINWKWSNFIDFFDINWLFQYELTFLIEINFFDLLMNNLEILINSFNLLIDSFNLSIKYRLKMIDFNRIYMEIISKLLPTILFHRWNPYRTKFGQLEIRIVNNLILEA